jgi:hypothetical protein
MKYIDGIKSCKCEWHQFTPTWKRIMPIPSTKTFCEYAIKDKKITYKFKLTMPQTIHIPIWEEIVNIPDDYYECLLPDIDWKDVDGMTIPFRIINKRTLED